jgi:D-3-phosphoglycerate dehydrogenase / 2-oxoglutarate reductase
MKTVYRLDFSSYFSSDFKKREKAVLEGLGGIHYADTLPEQGPVVLLTNSQTLTQKIPNDLLARTELIIHPNSGYDNFEAAWVDEKQIPVIVGNPIRAQAVAEVALCALWERVCPLPSQVSWSKTRQFERDLLCEKNVLLVGHGLIGHYLEQALRPITKSVMIFDPFKNHLELDLRKANIVIIAASLNPSSHHFINQSFLEQLPSGFILINPARGAIVELKALLSALDRDTKAYAYLDVFETEPMQLEEFMPYQRRGQIKTTSHIAGVFNGLSDRLLSFEFQTLKDYLSMDKKQFLSTYQHLDLRHRRRGHFLI